MEKYTLAVKTRDIAVKAKTVRNEGLIPGVFYGADTDNQIISMDYQDFRRLFKKAGSHALVELDVDGKGMVPTMIHDVQYDPVTDNFTHVDFVSVNMNKAITAEVPITFVGVSPAVKDLAGTLMTNRDVVEIKCLPKDLPDGFEVDISVLEDFQHSIHMSDLAIPEGVELLVEEGVTIATVVPPKEEEVFETEAAEGEEVAEGEEGEKKEGEEGEKKEGEEGGDKKDEKSEGGGKGDK